MNIEEYRSLLKRRELYYTLKTGVKFKRRNFHRIIAYLSKQSLNYSYSKSEVTGEHNISSFHLKREEDHLLQIKNISDIFFKFVPNSSLKEDKFDNKYEFIIRFLYNRKDIDWAAIDVELINNHSDNIFYHGAMKIPLMSNSFIKWWN